MLKHKFGMERLRVIDLKAEAKRRGLRGYSKLRKAELINLLTQRPKGEVIFVEESEDEDEDELHSKQFLENEKNSKREKAKRKRKSKKRKSKKRGVQKEKLEADVDIDQLVKEVEEELERVSPRARPGADVERERLNGWKRRSGK